MIIHDLIALQRTNIKSTDYLNTILKEYKQLKHFLPRKINSVLDIGCGIGGIDIFLFRDYGSKITFLDRDGVDKQIVYGYNQTSNKYNLLSETKRFVEMHGVYGAKYINIDQEQFPSQKYDLTISLLAMGYHFPIDTYRPNTKYMIVDIRDGLPLSETWQVIFKGENYKRILNKIM